MIALILAAAIFAGLAILPTRRADIHAMHAPSAECVECAS